MSPPQKKQNNSKKREDPARSKQAKQSSLTRQTNESTTIENNETAASYSIPDIRTSVMDEEKAQLELDFVVQNHQELLINKCLNDNIQERDKDQYDSYEKVVKTAILKLQAELKDVGDLSKLPSLQKDFNNIVAEAKKKIEICDELTDDIKEDYATVIEYITQKMQKINQVNANTNELIQKSIDEQIIFDREKRLVDERLEKLNREIVLASKKRDEMVQNLSESKKTIGHMTKAYTKLTKTNKRLTRQINKKKCENQESDAALAAIDENVRKCIIEKQETIKKLDEEEIELKDKQAILLAGLSNAKLKYKNLCQEEDDLTKKTADQEKQIAQLNTANKNLREDKTAKLLFQQKYSQLSIQLQKITHENAKMQNSVAEKQQQSDNLNCMKVNILKKQRNYKELQMRVVALKNQNADTSAKLSISKKNVNDMKKREDLRGMAAISFAKRIRYSSTNTTTDDPEQMDAMSDASSINLRDLEGSNLESDFDFTNFSEV